MPYKSSVLLIGLGGDPSCGEGAIGLGLLIGLGLGPIVGCGCVIGRRLRLAHLMILIAIVAALLGLALSG